MMVNSPGLWGRSSHHAALPSASGNDCTGNKINDCTEIVNGLSDDGRNVFGEAGGRLYKEPRAYLAGFSMAHGSGASVVHDG
jgi:hypothetical protein